MRLAGGTLLGQIRTAPLTSTWLAALFVTTAIARSLSSAELNEWLLGRSTNIDNLHDHPLRVIFSSILWIDGGWWLPYAVFFVAVVAPVERWLGTVRFFVVGFSAHVLATYISQGALRHAIELGIRSPSLVNVRDVGVSYFLAAILGVLTYHIARPWRWAHLVAILALVTIPLIEKVTFTGIGHATALLIGLSWYPITRGRPARQWDPSRVKLRHWDPRRFFARGKPV